MKVASWNVNSLKVRLPQLLQWLQAEDPDVVCLQELKAQEDPLQEALYNPPGYHRFCHFAQKKGYSGVAIYT
ncbi:MAG TPA: exodeoxyribonuclease III, partial [Candidatus Handelsmanbacteria bacterium]|nr:exodeoxyribonuclease III [Candidatus Handelsmanbacteria bacterium]